MASMNIDSSWIAKIEYVRNSSGMQLENGAKGFLVVRSTTGYEYAYAVPSWMAGVLASSIKRGGSPGRSYNKLLRRRWPSVKVAA